LLNGLLPICSAGGASGLGATSVSAMPFSAGSSALSYAPSSSTALGGTGSGISTGNSLNINQIVNGVNNLNKATSQQQQQPQQQISAPRTGFDFKATPTDTERVQQILAQQMGSNPFNNNPYINRR